MVGYISHVDYQNETFYVLLNDQPGMIGSRNGIAISFQEVNYVRAEDRPGVFEEDQLARWRHYLRTGGS